MGTDIYGYIEVGRRGRGGGVRWAAIEARSVLRHYDMFGCLFGVSNYANFRPVVPERGIPEDASPEVKQRVAELLPWAEADPTAFHSATWITWAEIKAIDWQEEALEADSRLRRYRRAEDGTLVYEGKSSWSGELAAAVGMDITEAIFYKLVLPDGVEFELGEHVYRAVKMKREDVLDDRWRTVFEKMEGLAEEYGDELVRWVVWFDS